MINYNLTPLGGTGWNTKISARETNYGTRIDFILITPGLLPWVSGADIQPHIKGSDHCPVFVDFREELLNSDGSITRLSQVLGASVAAEAERPEPPRISAKHWDEHKQKLLSSFFGKKRGTAPEPSSAPLPSASQPSDITCLHMPSPAEQSEKPTFRTPPEAIHIVEPEHSSSSAPAKRKLTVEASFAVSTKKLKTQPSRKESSRMKNTSKTGQQSLAAFFATPKPSSSSVEPKSDHVDTHLPSSSPPERVDEDADYQFALMLSQSSLSSSQPSDKGKGSKQAWTDLLAPTQVPLCLVHGEPAKEYTVNKLGPNKGKKFFLCSRSGHTFLFNVPFCLTIFLAT